MVVGGFWSVSTHYGTKPGHFETSIIPFPTSEEVSEVSERANERTDERVAQYLRLDSCLFQTPVQWLQRVVKKNPDLRFTALM